MRSQSLAQFYHSFCCSWILCAAVALCAPSSMASGLDKTVFQSVSWQLPNEVFLSVAVHPIQPETAVVGGETGIYRTEDGGQNWERVLFLEALAADDSSFFEQTGQSSALMGLSEDDLLDADEDDFQALKDLTAQQGVLPQNILPQNILPQNILPQNNQSFTAEESVERPQGVFQMLWIPTASNIVLAATHMGLFISESAGRSFRRISLGEGRSESVVAMTLVKSEPLEVIIALPSELLFFEADSESADRIKGIIEGESVSYISPMDAMKKGWVKTSQNVYELHGHSARRRIALGEGVPRGMAVDASGNALVVNGKNLHWLPANAMAQYRHFSWPFAPISAIAHNAGCGQGWLFHTESGWVWADENDLGLWKNTRQGSDQLNQLLCVKENEVDHVWAVGPYGVFRELSADGQKDLKPERLMAVWQQEPSLSQVGVWGLNASHFAYNLPMEHIRRAHLAAYLPELSLYFSYGNDGQQRNVVDLLPEQREALEDQGIDPDDLGIDQVQDTLGLGENPWGQGKDIKMFVWFRWRYNELAFWAAPWQQMSRLQPSIYQARQKRLLKLKELYENRKVAQLRSLKRARDPLEAELWGLRVEELTAQINALTGGAYGRALQEVR